MTNVIAHLLFCGKPMSLLYSLLHRIVYLLKVNGHDLCRLDNACREKGVKKGPMLN